MFSRVACRWLLSVALLALAAPASAQRLSESATIQVSLRVLAHVSFEGGTTHALAMAVRPGVAATVTPAEGVRTAMSYNAVTRVTVTSTVLHGPDGATLTPRLLCAHGAPGSRTLAGEFDCAAGFVAELAGERATTTALGVGATLDPAAARGAPAGLYAGQITLTAFLPAS
ncbi:MAG: hypothetical protein JWN79_823 [Gemmatimonadetes bacterium]|jgi:hypothetical protein|nr:hypothetical protein [Gemmatimonadota bacterium]